MRKLLISIVVPAYNIRSYLGRCLESLMNQSYKNIQIIVVDDGSTDGTRELLDTYAAKDSRIVALHKENEGVSSARLYGITYAQGDYIGFCDGDDFAEEKMFEHLLRNALKYHADISHCGYKMVFPDGHEDVYYGTGRLVIQNHEEGLADLLKGEFVEPGLWNKIYKKELVEKFENTPCWDSTIRINEDLLMNYILFSRAKSAVYEDIPYYHYMLREGSAATSSPQRYKLLDPLKVRQLILEDLRGAEPLNSVVLEHELRILIHISQQADWIDDANAARDILREKLSTAHTSNISRKIRIMAACAAYMPLIYGHVRHLYDHFTGNDRKYKLS